MRLCENPRPTKLWRLVIYLILILMYLQIEENVSNMTVMVKQFVTFLAIAKILSVKTAQGSNRIEL